jgi:hypothetical protein
MSKSSESADKGKSGTDAASECMPNRKEEGEANLLYLVLP